MSMLGSRLQGARVLDLFAGCGGLGVEALSRGAASCVLVEADGGAARRLEEAFGGEVSVVFGDACDPGRWGLSGCYSVVFLDPPWGSGLDVRALEALVGAGLTDGEATAVVVHASGDPPRAVGWAPLRSRRHGDGEVTLLSRREMS